MTEVAKPLEGQYLTFQVNSELFGLPIQDVREINQHGEVTPLPYCPDYVKGVMNLRGKIIPVVNLRVRFGMKEIEINRESCIIVIETQKGHVGMIVDAVKEVVDLTTSQLEAPPNMGHNPDETMIKGLGKIETRVIILIDVRKSLLTEDFDMPEQAA
jgi:purine-binding chemotaxis protein CheW